MKLGKIPYVYDKERPKYTLDNHNRQSASSPISSSSAIVQSGISIHSPRDADRADS